NHPAGGPGDRPVALLDTEGVVPLPLRRRGYPRSMRARGPARVGGWKEPGLPTVLSGPFDLTAQPRNPFRWDPASRPWPNGGKPRPNGRCQAMNQVAAQPASQTPAPASQQVGMGQVLD